MADQKISDLVNISIQNVADEDEFVIADISASDNRSISFGELKMTSGTDSTTSKFLTNDSHGVFGYFNTDDMNATSDADTVDRSSRYRWTSGTTGIATFMGGAGVLDTYLRLSGSGIQRRYQVGVSSEGIAFRAEGSSGFDVADWNKVWGEYNTTVDGSGFILEASPIVRVYADSVTEPNDPVGAVLTHTETGVYILSGVKPLATEGWQVRTPEDLNGNKVVAIGQPEYDASAETLTIRTYDLLWENGRLVPGDPMDIPGGYFVMLRFEGESDEV